MSGEHLIISLTTLAGAVLGMLIMTRTLNKQIVRFTVNESTAFISAAAIVFAVVGYWIGKGISWSF